MFNNSCLMKKINLRKLESNSEIEIMIEGQGVKQIINKSFVDKPNKIFINDEEKNITDFKYI